MLWNKKFSEVLSNASNHQFGNNESSVISVAGKSFLRHIICGEVESDDVEKDFQKKTNDRSCRIDTLAQCDVFRPLEHRRITRLVLAHKSL